MSFSLKTVLNFSPMKNYHKPKKTHRERKETNPNLMLKVVLRHLDPSFKVFSTSDIVMVLRHPDEMHGVISI